MEKLAIDEEMVKKIFYNLNVGKPAGLYFQCCIFLGQVCCDKQAPFFEDLSRTSYEVVQVRHEVI